MNPNDLPIGNGPQDEAADLLSPLLQGYTRAAGDRPHAAALVAPARIDGVVIGELLAIVDGSKAPLVRYAGATDGAAVKARSTVDLHGAHVGAQVVLVFDHGDPAHPIVVGVLRGEVAWPLDERPAQVDVDADGQRMVVSAKEQLVLRCGKASITLTKSGKVLIEGSYLLSRSTGVNRIKGGSVQLN